MIRDGARQTLWHWREVLTGAVVLAAGLWLAGQGGYLLVPLGGVLAVAGLSFGVLGLRRMRFAALGDVPGIVQVDEAQISYMGPQAGGFVSLSDLSEIRIVTFRGRRVWRLKQSDGQALLVPLDAKGAEGLFDAFASLPGLSSADLVAAIGQPPKGTVPGAVPGGPALVPGGVAENRVVWQRRGRGVVTR